MHLLFARNTFDEVIRDVAVRKAEEAQAMLGDDEHNAMLGGRASLTASGLADRDYSALLQGIQRVRRNREAERDGLSTSVGRDFQGSFGAAFGGCGVGTSGSSGGSSGGSKDGGGGVRGEWSTDDGTGGVAPSCVGNVAAVGAVKTEVKADVKEEAAVAMAVDDAAASSEVSGGARWHLNSTYNCGSSGGSDGRRGGDDSAAGDGEGRMVKAEVSGTGAAGRDASRKRPLPHGAEIVIDLLSDED